MPQRSARSASVTASATGRFREKSGEAQNGDGWPFRLVSTRRGSSRQPRAVIETAQSGRPLTGPLSSGVRNRRRIEASKDSRSSVHAHPVFHFRGCTSAADAHQTPIWIRCGRIAHPGATHRPSTHSSPRKSSVPAAVQGKSQSARARRKAASQSVDDSATRRIEPTTVYGGHAWVNHQSSGFAPVRFPIYPGWPNLRYTNRRSGAKGT